ncbi:MAG: acyltransferase [Burkholderiales bacterium]|nr:acyltransferase [Burkholderiales bacterium]
MSTSADGLIRSHHALRGVAAFIVLLFHFRDVTTSVGQALDARTAFLSNGRIWVDFFFLLSGFILSHVYGKSVAAAPAAGRKTKEFYLARFARIYPLHIVTLLAMILVEVSAYIFRPEIADAFVNEDKQWPSILRHLTLTHAWVSLSHLQWNAPSWSISTEAFAYLCFPLLVLLLGHSNRAVRALPALAAIIVYVHTFSTFDDIGEQQPLLRCMAGFVGGMILYRIWLAYRSRLLAFVSPLQLSALVIAIIAMHIGLNQAVAMIALAVLILTTADDSGPLARVLAWRPMLLLGTLSYSIYMTHWIFYRLYWMYGGYVFADLASAYSPVKVYALKVGLLTILSLSLAYISYRWIELPSRSRLKRLFAH